MRTHQRIFRMLIVSVIALAAAVPVVAIPAAAEPSRAELDNAIDKLGELEQKSSQLVEEYNTLRAQLEETREDLAKAGDELAHWSEEADVATAELEERAADLYKSGMQSQLEAYFSEGDINDVNDRLTYLSALAEDNEEAAVEASVATQEAQWAREAAQKAEATLEQQEAELERRRKELDGMLAEQKDLVAQLEDEYQQAMEEWRRQQAAAPVVPPSGGGDTPPDTGGGGNPPPPSSRAAVAVQTAIAQVGDRYQWGAAGPDEFDCSGLTLYSWAAAGVSLPHGSWLQYGSLPHVSQSDLQPGDLVFFDTDKDGDINHVGIITSGTTMVHAFSEGSPVGYDSATSGYYGGTYVGAARPG